MTEPVHLHQNHRTGSLYGALAFGSIIVTTFATFLQDSRLYRTELWAVPVTFALGAVFAVLGIVGAPWLDGRPSQVLKFAYYLLQCAVLTAMIFISPIRGFFGVIVLPLVSQAIFDLKPRWAAAVAMYLFALNVAVWGFPYGWPAAWQAVLSYSAGFAFTIIFTIITKQAVAARMRSEKLQRELADANAQLLAHAAQTEELATTRERNRVAREIHDGVGHYLTVIKTQLDAAHALIPAQPARGQEAVAKAAHLTAEALEDVRRSVGALRTDTRRPPLPEALRELAGNGDPVPTLAIEGAPRPLAPGVEHALYRAAQEGLTNIRKHARASQTLLRLDFRDPARLVLELSDNGIGTAGSSRATAGFGLRGLRERIEVMGGTVHAADRLEGGFALRIEVPATVASPHPAR